MYVFKWTVNFSLWTWTFLLNSKWMTFICRELKYITKHTGFADLEYCKENTLMFIFLNNTILTLLLVFQVQLMNNFRASLRDCMSFRTFILVKFNRHWSKMIFAGLNWFGWSPSCFAGFRPMQTHFSWSFSSPNSLNQQSPANHLRKAQAVFSAGF